LHYLAALAAQLMGTQEALSVEKAARSSTAKALAEAEQALKNSNAVKAKLPQALKSIKAAYTITRDNLACKSKELDDVVIREQEANALWEQAEAKLAEVEKKPAAVGGEKKDQGLLLESTRLALSNHEDSFVQMISTTMANAMALLKSHLPNLDVELRRKDFMVDEAECKVLTSGAYDATHEFASSYDFSSLAESEDNDSPRIV
jgi:chromosome segregation ATPase